MAKKNKPEPIPKTDQDLKPKINEQGEITLPADMHDFDELEGIE